MGQTQRSRRRAFAFLASLAITLAGTAIAQAPKAGVVVMHGKGGLPDGVILDLARFLEAKGFAVANLEMPWSSRRDYDVDVAGAENQVDAALGDLRAKGAAKVFLAGHSQGGAFALYASGKLRVDGIVAIAPGGNVASPTFRDAVGESVRRARTLVDEGKGAERQRFLDYEGARGTTPVITNAAAYLTWFDPEGAMFGALPKNPLTQLYEPDANHLRAPSAAREEIARWIAEVAAREP